ncbi:sulfotransferase [Pseudomonadota bacterium]
MAIDPKKFEAKPWRKPLRKFKECLFIILGKFMRSMGLLRNFPKNPVFIIGCPRSGTSIFNKMISECQDVANLSEAIYIWSPGDTDIYSNHVKSATDVSPEEEKRIKGAFGFYQFLKRKRIFVNKCPRSSVRVPFIRAIFPDAKYIHVYRDGRAVVNSIINIIEREDFRKCIPLGAFCKPKNWRNLAKMPSVEGHSYQWLEIIKEVQTASTGFDDSQWLNVSYEAFCSDPGKVMSGVFQFMNVNPTEKLLMNISQMPLSNNQKWRQKFSNNEIETMNRIMGKQLTAYGYEL